MIVYFSLVRGSCSFSTRGDTIEGPSGKSNILSTSLSSPVRRMTDHNAWALPLNKIKKGIAGLRSRSTSDERTQFEDFGEEFKKAKRLAKLDKEREEFVGPHASGPTIWDAMAGEGSAISFPPGYPGFDQKGIRPGSRDRERRSRARYLSPQAHASVCAEDFEYNENLFPDRVSQRRKTSDQYKLTYMGDTDESSGSARILRPKKIRTAPESLIDFDEAPVLSKLAHAEATVNTKLPGSIAKQMALIDPSSDEEDEPEEDTEYLGIAVDNPVSNSPSEVRSNLELREVLEDNLDLLGQLGQVGFGSEGQPILDPRMKRMNDSPMGRLFLETWAKASSNRRGDTVEGPSGNAYVRLAKDYEASKRRQRDTERSEIVKQIGKYHSAMKQIEINKYYTYHSKIGGVVPPKVFSPEGTLHRPMQLRNCNSTFPLLKPFSDDGKGPDICTFLRQMTKAQKRVSLSREEFLEILLECCRKPALDRIGPLVGMNYPIETLYSILVSTYDRQITPHEASELLARYRAHKSKTIHEVNSDLTMIAARAAQEFSSSEVSREFFDEETTKALIRCLPEKASRRAKQLRADMRQKLERNPTFNEFSCAMANEEEEVNVEIRKNGVDTKEMLKLSLYTNQHKNADNPTHKASTHKEGGSKKKKFNTFYNNKYTSGQVNQVTEALQALNVKPRGKVNEIKTGKPDYHVKINENDRLRCILCDQRNHQASDGCKCIFTDQGIAIKETTATSGDCSNCVEKLGKHLKHSAKLCPIRDKALELYKSGTVLPRGMFRQYCVDNKIGDVKPWANRTYNNNNNYRDNTGNNSNLSPHNRGGKRYGSVKMISVSNLIADLPLPDKDFHVFTIEPQARDTFGAKLYLDVEATCPCPDYTRTLTCLVDTGSDSCLISRSYLGKAFNMEHDQVECYLHESDLNLLSYTNDNIDISGKITLSIKVPFTNRKENFDFYVVDDLFVPSGTVTPMLLGLSALVRLSLVMDSIQMGAKGQTPYLYSKHDKQKTILSNYMTSKDLSECYSHIECLEPYETKACHFYLDHFYDYLSWDSVLISDDFIRPGTNPIPLQILLTRSDLIYDKEEGKLRGMGIIVNHGGTEYRNLKMVGYFERGTGYKIQEIDATAHNFNKTQKIIFPYPDAFVQDSKIQQKLNKHKKKRVFKSSQVKEIKAEDLVKLGTSDPISIVPYSIYKVNKIDTYFPENVNIRAAPNSINNGQGNKKISLTDERQPVKETHKSDPSKIKLFNDPTKTCQLGQRTFDDDEDFMLTGAGAGRGYSLPTQTDKDDLALKREFLNLDQYEPLIKTYVEDIFMKKHSSIIATSSLSRGDMSRTLGTYSISLKEGVQLPKHKKVYFVAPMEALQLQAILEFLLKNGTIVKAKIGGDKVNEFSSPGYLIPKHKPDSAPRLVINFQSINQVIAAEPAILPSAESIIHGLRDAYFFSVNDVSNAFHSVSIDAASRELTAFSVPVGGTYQHTCLPTGMKTSPEALNRIMHKALHFIPDLGEKGEEQWNSDGTLKMKYDPIKECQFLYDDILCWSKAMETYELSVKEHFRVLEQVISRLDYHQVKIGIHKSQLCKTYINFFGYYISNNFVMADPARVKKLIEAPEPKTRKEARSFLGVANSMRDQLGFDVIKKTGSLQRLTSSTKTKDKYVLDDEQRADFNGLKDLLKEGPIFSKVIDISAPKIIFSDMAGQTEGACYGATLCQIVYPKEGQVTVPAYIDLEDPCHRIIYNLKIMARPLPNKPMDQSIKAYLKQTDAVPPAYFYQLKEKYLGYTEEEAKHSLGISLKLLLEVTNCGVTFENIIKNVSSTVRSGIERANFMDFIFNQDRNAFNNYIRELEAGKLVVDEKLFIIEILSTVMFISATSDFPAKKEFNSSAYKPPIYLFIYKVDGMYVVKPAVSDRQQALNLANFRGCLEVVSYIAKPISDNHKHLHILDLELQGIMHALSSFRKLVGQSECLLATDSQGLYFLFNSLNLKTNKRLNRWNYSLLEIMPQLQIYHVTTDDMLADFLTRQYQLNPGKKDFTLLKLQRFNKKLYDDLVPNIAFSLSEWKDFVEKHKELIFTLDNCEAEVKTSHVKTIKYSIKAVASVLTPAAILKKKLTQQKIIEEQRIEFKELFEECSAAPNHELFKDKKRYILHNGMICILEDDKYLTLCPETLLPIFISYAHLLTAHGGTARMLLNLSLIFHPDKIKLVRNFCRACHNCQMTNCNTHLNEIGTYPTATRAMECISVDYIENLPANKYKFKHACIMTCFLTGAIIAVPTRTLEAHEFLRIFLFNAYQTFSPRQVLCDGAKAFLSIENLVVLASLGVRVLEASAHNARGKGTVERQNGILKSAIMKTFGSKDDNGWVYALPCIVRQLNSTLSPRTGYAPIDLLFGLGVSDSIKHFNMLPYDQTHYMAQNYYQRVVDGHEERKGAMDIAKEKLQDTRVKRVEKINTHRMKKDIMVDDFVFVKNFSGAKGKSTAFRQIFYPTPYRVIQVAPVTAVVQRLSDHFDTKLHFDHLKPYRTLDPAFDFVPSEVKSIVSKDFSQLSDKEIATICENSTFEIPVQSITLDDHDPNFRKNIVTLENNEKENDTEIDLDIVDIDSESDSEENDHHRKMSRKRTQTVRYGIDTQQ